MTQAEQNKAVVRAFIDAVNAQAWERLDDLVAVDVIRHGPASGQGPLRSRVELKAFLRREAATFPDAHEAVHFLVAEGDKVAALLGFRGAQRGALGPFPASGRTLTADFIAIFRVAGGRITEVWVAWDSWGALIQLGHVQPMLTHDRASR